MTLGSDVSIVKMKIFRGISSFEFLLTKKKKVTVISSYVLMEKLILNSQLTKVIALKTQSDIE